ncbi:MAG: aspartate--tRNA ligase [candidate division Zixibacteria bacterium]|nr:aspartate--tRNA ligase [candidate division Zixibacteria bacterium]
MLRTHTCGELNERNVGAEATLCGWVWKSRDLGGVLFVDLRDRYGFTQLVVDPAVDKELHEAASKLKGEDVVRVAGEVRLRPEEQRRDDVPTGAVELHVRKLEVLARAKTPPFNLAEEELEVHEDLRLEYRYLDLRRPHMQRNLAVRHRAVKAIREYLSARGFVEIETPNLMRSTPEGARDYLVPSRLHRGRFYALPQSPQMYKQLLMAAGVDRYFQIARCFRDEDQRADRQPEFTQLDLEMSFAEEEDVFDVTEGVFAASFREGIGVELEVPWPRLTWREAMSRYGRDKPDTRFGLEFADVTELFKNSKFLERGHKYAEGAAFALKVPGGLTRKQLGDVEQAVTAEKFPGVMSFTVGGNGEIKGPALKHFPGGFGKQLLKYTKGEEGDGILVCAGEFGHAANVLGTARLKVADVLDIKKEKGFNFLWVTDFPLFERDPATGEPVPSHHPFTSPRLEDADKLEAAPFDVTSRAYDVTVNGVELGSGSVRIHDAALQRRVFKAFGYSDEEIEARFGFFLRALEYGTPPHAGIAPGLDRWVMVMRGERSIRDVIAFPKTLRASSPMDGSPAPVAREQLDELGLTLKDEGPEGK